jgi:predicted DNA binding CopG/RHH family protein
MAKLATEMTAAELDELISKQVLDPEEQEIEDAFASGLLRADPDLPTRNKEWQEALANTERKLPLSLRVSSRVIGTLRLKAREEGMPYQTLINSILHKYVTGQLKERD